MRIINPSRTREVSDGAKETESIHPRSVSCYYYSSELALWTCSLKFCPLKLVMCSLTREHFSLLPLSPRINTTIYLCSLCFSSSLDNFAKALYYLRYIEGIARVIALFINGLIILSPVNHRAIFSLLLLFFSHFSENTDLWNVQD